MKFEQLLRTWRILTATVRRGNSSLVIGEKRESFKALVRAYSRRPGGGREIRIKESPVRIELSNSFTIVQLHFAKGSNAAAQSKISADFPCHKQWTVKSEEIECHYQCFVLAHWHNKCSLYPLGTYKDWFENRGSQGGSTLNSSACRTSKQKAHISGTATSTFLPPPPPPLWYPLDISSSSSVGVCLSGRKFGTGRRISG